MQESATYQMLKAEGKAEGSNVERSSPHLPSQRLGICRDGIDRTIATQDTGKPCASEDLRKQLG
jgi:hypothetical protein